MMNNRMFVRTWNAGAAITKRRVVKFNGSGLPVLAAAAGDLAIGISDNAADIASGARVDVVTMGQPEVEAGAAIAAGASVTSDSTGRVKLAATGDVAIGTALEAAIAAGDIIHVLLGRHTAA